MSDERLVTLKALTQTEINHLLTTLYVLVEVGRQENRTDGLSIRQALGTFLLSIIICWLMRTLQRKSSLPYCYF